VDFDVREPGHTTIYGLGAAEGLNERGLGTHTLYLTACDFGPRDVARPGLQAGPSTNPPQPDQNTRERGARATECASLGWDDQF
jgi:hypothetical protein